MSDVDKPPPLYVPWKSLDVAAALAAVIVASIGLAAVLAAVTEDTGVLSPASIIVGVAGVSLILFGVSWLFGPLKHRSPVSLLGFRAPRSSPAALWLLPLGVLFLSLLLNGVYSVLVDYFSAEALEPPELPEFTIATGLVSGVLFAGVGPLAEEVFFRGFALQGLARRFGVTGGVIGSSLLFGALHVNLILPTFLIGLLLAFLFVRTRSILPCFLVHGAHNALVFIVTVAS